jgi:hypothetical protein
MKKAQVGKLALKRRYFFGSLNKNPMRYIVLILALLFSSTVTSAQIESRLDSVQCKLAGDEDAYRIFLGLAQCRAMDLLAGEGDTSPLYDRHFTTLYDLRYALPRLLSGEKQALKGKIDTYYASELDAVVTSMRKKDEYFKTSWSSRFFIAGMLFGENEKTKALYLQIINDRSLYTTHDLTLQRYLMGLRGNAMEY